MFLDKSIKENYSLKQQVFLALGLPWSKIPLGIFIGRDRTLNNSAFSLLCYIRLYDNSCKIYAFVQHICSRISPRFTERPPRDVKNFFEKQRNVSHVLKQNDKEKDLRGLLIIMAIKGKFYPNTIQNVLICTCLTYSERLLDTSTLH